MLQSFRCAEFFTANENSNRVPWFWWWLFQGIHFSEYQSFIFVVKLWEKIAQHEFDTLENLLSCWATQQDMCHPQMMKISQPAIICSERDVCSRTTRSCSIYTTIHSGMSLWIFSRSFCLRIRRRGRIYKWTKAKHRRTMSIIIIGIQSNSLTKNNSVSYETVRTKMFSEWFIHYSKMISL